MSNSTEPSVLQSDESPSPSSSPLPSFAVSSVPSTINYDNECNNETISTTYLDNLGSFGNMFDVQLFEYDLTLTQLDFYTDVSHEVHYELYFRKGTFRDAKKDISLWSLLKTGSTHGHGKGKGTPIKGLDVGLTGHTIFGFYLTLNTTDLRYRNIRDDLPDAVVGTPYIRTNDMEIHVGVSVGDYPMSNTFFGKRVWSGTLHYTAHRPCHSSSPSLRPPVQPTMFPSTGNPSVTPTVFPSTEMPSVAPSTADSGMPTTAPSEFVPSAQPTLTSLPSLVPSFSASPSVLPTPLNRTNICVEHHSVEAPSDGGKGAFGNMFTVTSKEERITITSVSIHAGIVGKLTAEVYTRQHDFLGHENDSKGWIRVAHAVIQSRVHRVMIPRESFAPIRMEPNQTVALYVTLTTSDLRYTKTNATVGTPIAESKYLNINSGVGLADYPFSSEFFLYSPRAFNGVVLYDTETECLPTTSVVFAMNIQTPLDAEPNMVLQLIEITVEKTVRQLMSSSPILVGYVENFGLGVEKVSADETANASCVDASAQFKCLSVDAVVLLRHSEDLKPGQLRFDLLSFRQDVTLAVESYFDTSYVGEVSTSAGMKVKLDAIAPVEEMGDVQINVYEASAKAFLQESLKDQKIHILEVKITGQSVKSLDQQNRALWTGRKLDAARKVVTSVEIETKVLAEYRPPPDFVFADVLDDRVAENADKLSEKVKAADPYFDVFEGASIETVKEDGSSPVSLSHENWLTQTIWRPVVVGVASLLFLLLFTYIIRSQQKRRKGQQMLGNLVSTEGLYNLKMKKGGLLEWLQTVFKRQSTSLFIFSAQDSRQNEANQHAQEDQMESNLEASDSQGLDWELQALPLSGSWDGDDDDDYESHGQTRPLLENNDDRLMLLASESRR